jgi:hypothetical protein
MFTLQQNVECKFVEHHNVDLQTRYAEKTDSFQKP